MNHALQQLRRGLLVGLLTLGSAATFQAAQAASPQQPDPETRRALRAAIAQAESFPDRYAAEVWLVDMDFRLARFVKNPQQRLLILQRVHLEASRYQLQPEILLAVMQVESTFDRFAVSPAGALGLMQIMPFWRGEIGEPSDNLMDITTNIRYGSAILSVYLTREKGNLRRALARYNGSLGKSWYPEKVFNAWQNNWYVNH